MFSSAFYGGCRVSVGVLFFAFVVSPTFADPPAVPAGTSATLGAPDTSYAVPVQGFLVAGPPAAAAPFQTSPFPANPTAADPMAVPFSGPAFVNDGPPVFLPESRYLRELKPAWDNFSIFGGLDGAKGPDDLGVSANFGVRFAAQTGFPLVESWGLGMQVGTGLNYERTATRFLHVLTGTNERTQSFTTIGLFQRTESGWNWGVVYDFLYESYYVDMTLGQWRGQAGYWIDPNNEVGAWGTLRSQSERLIVGADNLALQPIDQVNLYWRHVWPTNVVTRGWVGLAEGHGRYILIGPSSSPVSHPVVFGADVFIPLSANVAIFGEANFITPNDSGTVTALFGLVFYPAGTAGDAFRNRFAPLLPTSNNPTFGVNVQ